MVDYGNLTHPQLSACMHTTGVRNISIRNIMSISRSVDDILYLPS
jgi:hypothetical protein